MAKIVMEGYASEWRSFAMARTASAWAGTDEHWHSFDQMSIGTVSTKWILNITIILMCIGVDLV